LNPGGKDRDLLEYSEAEKTERFLLRRAIMSDVEVLNKDAAVAFVTGDLDSTKNVLCMWFIKNITTS
jgi:hypothetical protein